MTSIIKQILENSAAAAILAATIPILVVVLTWFLNQWAERRREENIRREKMNDVMQALIAEINAFTRSNNYKEDKLDVFIKKIDDVFETKQSKIKYVPFIPTEKHDRVFEAIIGDIQILPRKTINPVVAYYSQITSINKFAEDLKTPAYASLSTDRRKAMLLSYLNMIKFAFKLAGEAREALEAEIQIIE